MMGHLTFGIWISYKKNLWIFFQKYGFIRKIEPFHLRMKHNIIQMAATAGLTIPHSINPIFKDIFDCLDLNLMNGNFDFVFQGLNRLWMVSVTLILNGSPQKIVQRSQITAPRRSIDIRISADYSIFENGVQKIVCYVGSVESGPVFLKLNFVHVILFNFWEKKFVSEEKGPNDTTVLKSAPNSHSLWTHRLLNDDFWISWAPNAIILLIDLLPTQSKMYWKSFEWCCVSFLNGKVQSF